MKQVLSGDWLLSQLNGTQTSPFTIPGDVHSSLLATQLIENPYYRENELAVDWVHQQQWQLQRSFQVDQAEVNKQCILKLDQVDCFASIYVNDQLVGSTSSQFIAYHFDITSQLRTGVNTLRIEFDSTSKMASQAAADFPFELPFLSWNCRVPHTNMVRKTPCHAGWDWNICLMPIGVYGEVVLHFVDTHWIEDVKFEQIFAGDNVTLHVSATVHANQSIKIPVRLNVADTTVQLEQALNKGVNQVRWSLNVEHPARWWPVGTGEQTLHAFKLELGDQKVTHKLGFREVDIVQTPDEHGAGFRIDVNQRAIFMRGANWIPADALPQRITPDAVRELLQSAVDANMNMLRVWGGGQYEPDWFYDLCDELGILIWQDFMFSCNHYPAANPEWLELVRTEALQQTHRLSKHPCLALWCGDNELVGALKWWDVTQANRDRYLANYSRLNHTLEMTTENELADIDFWPSSPSVGHMDFGDGWKNDAAGDMHFWDVWHEAKPFSAYQDIHPRFCSEFGFQSFPSMPVIKTFTVEEDRNVSSSVMGVHQRNVGGNARIVETLVRYFEFPDSFERMVFLSQCQQAMAIKMAVEYWRALKPHCMGTLFWQLNDTWPVASWASLEYGGGWKLLQYAAQRFYAPVLVAMVPGHDRFGTQGQLLLKAINDHTGTIEVNVNLSAHDKTGAKLSESSFSQSVASDAAVALTSLSEQANADVAFYRWTWSSGGGDQGENEYWLVPYKDLSLPTPVITSTLNEVDGEQRITLNTDLPAYFVSVNLGGNHIYSDNGFTLLPGEAKEIRVTRILANTAAPVLDEIEIQHL